MVYDAAVRGVGDSPVGEGNAAVRGWRSPVGKETLGSPVGEDADATAAGCG